MTTTHRLMHFFTDEMGWCACGAPQEAACLVRDLLRLAPFYQHRDGIEKLLREDGVFYFVLYGLDRVNLIEHGGSVGGSWLTERGKEILRDLEEVTATDPELTSIFPDCTEDGFIPPDDCKECYPGKENPCPSTD